MRSLLSGVTTGVCFLGVGGGFVELFVVGFFSP